MSLALLLLIMLLTLSVTGLAHRRRLQPGLVLVPLAAAASFIPGLPRLDIAPEFILGLIIPPLLYSAAYNTSIGLFGKNIRPILALGIGLVALTTASVGAAAHLLLPALGWGGAFLLGAIVSPPDTAGPVGHGHALGLTRRVQSILMGESLLNDAMSLTLYTLALNSMVPQHVVSENAAVLLAYQSAVGLAVGLVLGVLANLVRSKMQHPTLETATGFVLPFAAYLLAEHFHASGILAVVVLALMVSANTLYDPRVTNQWTYQTRLKEREFWSVVDLLLEGFVFVYMGLQLRFVLDDLRAADEAVGQTLWAALVVMLVVVVIRLVWVLWAFSPVTLQRLARRKDPAAVVARPELLRKENILIGWTGMRGIVTLTAAAGLPLTLQHGEALPGRAAIQAVAFLVTIGTLLLQSATLPALSRRLKIDVRRDKQLEQMDIDTAYQLVKAAPAVDWEQQRQRLGTALVRRQMTEEAARTVMHRLDLEEAAARGEDG